MEILPSEILFSIFQFLPILDYLKLNRVCKKFKKVIELYKEKMDTLDFSTKQLGASTKNVEEIVNKLKTFPIKYVTHASYKLTDQSLAAICQIFSKTLLFLNLTECVKIKNLKCLADCAQLQSLNLTKCKPSVQELVLPKTLTQLILDEVPISSNFVMNTLSTLSKLEHLSIQQCTVAIDVLICLGSNPFPALKYLDLSWSNPGPSKETRKEIFEKFASNLKQLQNLSLEQCYNLISDQFVDILSCHCLELNSLNLEEGFYLCDISPLKRCTKLQFLNIKGCSVGDEDIKELKKEIPNLNIKTD